MSPTLPAVASLLVLATLTSAQRTLTPAQMEEDLFQLTGEFMTKHAGLFRYASREDIDEAFGEVLFAAAASRFEGLTFDDFHERHAAGRATVGQA